MRHLDPQDLSFAASDMSRHAGRESLQGSISQTVAIFSGLLDRKLIVQYDRSSGIDGNTIKVSLNHPDAYALAESLLAKLYFGSDSGTIDSFAYKFSTLAATRAFEDLQDAHIKLRRMIPEQVTPDEIERFFRDLLRVLERRRVYSLWQKLYPGSYAAISRATRTEVLARVSEVLSLHRCASAPYFDLLETKEDVGSGPTGLDRCITTDPLFPHIRLHCLEALHRVERKDLSVTLATVKWLVRQLVDDYMGTLKWDTTNPELRALAFLTLVAFSTPTHRGPGRSSVYNVPETSEQEEEQEELIDRVLGTPQEQLAQQFQSGEYAEAQLEAALEALSGGGGGGTVVVATPLAATLDEASDRECGVGPLPDAAVADRLRVVFSRVLGRASRVLDVCGSAVDTEALIQRNVSRNFSVPIYQRVGKRAGFDVVLLIDESTSMESGGKAEQVARACQVLSRALDYPFVRVTVWGFSATMEGLTKLVNFDSEAIATGQGLGFADGFTPLPDAIRAAARHLRGSPNKKHIFVLTDGEPVYIDPRQGDLCPGEDALKASRAAVMEARQVGADITGILVGEVGKQKVTYSMTSAELDFIFGSTLSWARIRADRLYEDLVQLVAHAFVRYVRAT